MAKGRGLAILNVVVGVTLLGLAFLQYRWIDHVMESDRRHRHRDAESVGRRISDQLRREMGDTIRAFVAAPPDGLADAHARWQRGAREPRLVSEIYFAERNDDDTWTLSRLDRASGLLAPAEWPADFATMQQQLLRDGAAPSALVHQAIHPGVPALLAAQRARGDRESIFDRGTITAVLLRLDRQALARLASIVVAPEISGASPADGPMRPEARRRRQPALGFVGYDASLALGGTSIYSSANAWPTAKDPDADAELVVSPFLNNPRPPPDALARIEGNWRISVRQRGGGVDAYVASARRRSFALSTAMLLLLGGSILMLIELGRRNQRLRAQEAAFVRVMTHELNTPVAIIRSAAENLQDGFVDAANVGPYGTLIIEETDRLHRMIGQVLNLASLHRTERRHPRQNVDISRLLEGVVERGRRLAAGSPLRIELSVAPALPPVAGDEASLATAFENLVVNAIRHAGAGEWVGVRARLEGTRVSITVEDCGPGIREEESRQIFEPFYRGRDSAEVSGAGLGLAIVQKIVDDHDGTITLERRSPGASFTITLPAVDHG